MNTCRSWIDPLPAEMQQVLESRMRPRSVSDAESIYTIGDNASECYRIRSGAVRISEYTLLGREFQLASWHAGDCFGEIDLIDGLPRFNNAYAVGRTELDVLDKVTFDRLRREHPEIERAISVHLCACIRRLASQVAEASLLPLRERLPRLLGELLGSTERAEIAGVSQNDLANMLGATRQSVSRELKELERQGWIELGYRSVSIRNRADFIARFGSGLERESPAGVGRTG